MPIPSGGRTKSKVEDYSGTKNVTVDGEALRALHKAQERLATELGFQPSLGQTVRALAHRYNEGKL